MPSRRMIDPAFWRSETMVQLTKEQRLLFLGLISNADDQGRLRAHPSLIRSDVFPFEDDPLDKIEADIQAIAATGSILVYEIDGLSYIQIVNWWVYQRPKWAWPSEMPPPPDWADRMRYRAGNQAVKTNWDGHDDTKDDAPDDSGTAVEPERNGDETIAEPAPSGSNSGSGSGSSKEEHAADAAPPPPEKPKRQRKPTERDKRIAALEKAFCEISGLPPPASNTQKQKRAAAQAWWNPLQAIAGACDNDVDRTKTLIMFTVEQMDKADLTISCPRSIEKTALAEQARRKRDGKHNGRSPPTGSARIDASLAAAQELIAEQETDDGDT